MKTALLITSTSFLKKDPEKSKYTPQFSIELRGKSRLSYERAYTAWGSKWVKIDSLFQKNFQRLFG